MQHLVFLFHHYSNISQTPALYRLTPAQRVVGVGAKSSVPFRQATHLDREEILEKHGGSMQ